MIKSVFGKKDDVKRTAEMDFEEQRSQLDQRISVVTQGLGRIGIRTVQLGTEESGRIVLQNLQPRRQHTSSPNRVELYSENYKCQMINAKNS